MEIEEQHPIPQQVSAYQFKLVGDMTLQQFFQVAGGALVALLIYSSTLPSYVKWPLILFSFLLGVALAFFPLEDRPLSKWIILFIKAIYSPTIYVWKQMSVRPIYFQAEPVNLPQPALIPLPSTQKGETPQESANLEKGEQNFLEKVTKHLNDLPVMAPQAAKPQATVVQVTQQELGVTIPQVKKIAIEPQEKGTVEQGVVSSPAASSNTGSYKVIPSTGTVTRGAQSAQFSAEAGPPLPPTIPNVVVGQVLEGNGKIVENAILEIKDSEGRAARALRSNKLGHFMIVTPLADGIYEIITEKEGLSFETVTIEAVGQIIPAIAIWAKKEGGKE